MFGSEAPSTEAVQLQDGDIFSEEQVEAISVSLKGDYEAEIAQLKGANQEEEEWDVKLCTDSEFQDDPDAAFNDDQCGKIYFNSTIDEIRLHNRGVGCKAFWEYVGKGRFDQVGERYCSDPEFFREYGQF